VLQHAQSETLGLIEDSLRSASKIFQYLRTFEGQPIPPDPNGYSALIVMGGPMGVYETTRYPFLLQEMRLIEGFVKKRLPVLGICLGSQLLAACFGARVQKGRRKEIGWYPIELSTEGKQDPVWQNVPSRFVAYHWHGDIFELPKGAALLASSEITPVQAYRYDERVYGVLFHMEVSENQIRQMLSEFADEIEQENLSAGKMMDQAKSHLGSAQEIGAAVFNRWAKGI
jgi:GMP synthase (glutamine-hydrolysing)